MAKLRVQHCLLNMVTRQYGPHPTSDLLGVDYFRTVRSDTEFPTRLGLMELFVRFVGHGGMSGSVWVVVSHLNPNGSDRQQVFRRRYALPTTATNGLVVADRGIKLVNVVLPGGDLRREGHAAGAAVLGVDGRLAGVGYRFLSGRKGAMKPHRKRLVPPPRDRITILPYETVELVNEIVFDGPPLPVVEFLPVDRSSPIASEELVNEIVFDGPPLPVVELTPTAPRNGVPIVIDLAPPVAESAPSPLPGPKPMPRTAFLFPGQGAQAVGMAAQLCQSLPAARDLFDQAAGVLGYDLLNLCANGPAERLNATDVSQPAIFVASLAALEQLKATEPDALAGVTAAAGLSLGEYTALVFAGAMSFADGLRVVDARGKAMQAAAEATPSGMVSILGMEVPEVESLVAEARGGDKLEVANLLCPGNTVVSGATAALDRVEKLCQEKGGIRTVRLAVAGAFHTELMKPADAKLAAVLEGVSVHAPRVPVWSNVDAKPHTDPAEIRGLLVRQVLSPVRWEETMRGLLADGVERFYEIGPGRVLAGLMKRVLRKADVRNVTA